MSTESEKEISSSVTVGRADRVASAEEAWAIISPIVEDEGLKLFDLDVPKGNRGILRVYIFGGVPVDGSDRDGGKHSAGLTDCAKVSRRILDLDCIERLCPGDCTLEVSTPGINRKLRRPEHFEGAVGEHVKLVVASTDRKETISGTLLRYEPEKVVLETDGKKREEREILISQVREARVDFIFR
jgi:ribosome maturation factor RimP